ncbi:hypothetical protein [Sphingomonas sp.]|uniref:hypothetical protein n=1 Tax=Sphingomonas sp. TaxID=28214 RepID=UPI001B1A1D14|nr:hypothetical protein [Sphingomonas sp.]MBO9712973.1 macro domain-containing protein [Sphingomonas sp.]
MRTIAGDLLAFARKGGFDVIVHGCHCTVGKGIALAIRRQVPEAHAADCATERSSREKSGDYSVARSGRDGKRFTLVNACTQFDWRGPGVKADDAAIRVAMRAVAREFSGARIGYPGIAAGLAGGDWSMIGAIIEEELAGLDHCLGEFAP